MKFDTSIPVQDPSKKAYPQDKIQTFLNAERHKFREHHNYSSLRTRESSKSNPERHKFQEHHNYSSLQTRESSKSNPERQEF